MMGYKATLLLLLTLVLSDRVFCMANKGFYGEEEVEGGRGEREPWFLLQNRKHVVKTDAGDMKVVRNFRSRVLERPMHIGFITMEPRSLFVPQYLDSSLILFIRRGEAKIGFIYKDEFAERRLNTGDIYRIPAGSAFYLVNTAEGQRLHCICSIDTSESLGLGIFQSFYIGGGRHPASILSGFEPETLATAFNVTREELKEVMTRQQQGPIVYVDDSHSPSMWGKFLKLKERERLQHLKRMVEFQQEPTEEVNQETWSLRKFLSSIFENRRDEMAGKSPDSYNIYKRKADFKNDYGWSLAIDDTDYKPLKHSGIGVYLVNLTAGSMMAPHVNPTATEYGIVLSGSGSIQIVYPNGTQAMNAKVREGDVFWIPRYFPFCQIASRAGPMEFFGFTTSAHKNRPQFLAGASSVLRTLRGPELAAAFQMREGKIDRLIDAQNEAVILPGASVAPPDETQYERMLNVLNEIQMI